jgi:hypothetical protein
VGSECLDICFFSHEKYHHDVNVQHFFIYVLFDFCDFFMFFMIFHDFFMIFHDFFMFFQKNKSAGASLVQVCCKLAPLVCNFDASLMPL